MSLFRKAFVAIVGRPDSDGGIDLQVLNAVAFFSALFSVIGGLMNLLVGLPSSSIWPFFVFAALLGGCYAATRTRLSVGGWNWAVYLTLLADFAFAWWVAEGSYGPGYLLFFIAIAVAIVVGNGIGRLAMVSIGVLVTIGLTVAEHIGLLVPRTYPDQLARLIDMGFLTVLVTVSIALIHYASYSSYERTLRLLVQERARTESLLHRVLPRRVADRLKNGERRIADRHENVVVIFADIVGFTRLSDGTDPKAVVEMLDGVFLDFDKLADTYGLEKIKTIGDCYMAAGGLFQHEDDTYRRAGAMALDMIELCHRRRRADRLFDIRIGVHNGPVVGGIIGRRRFVFDVWGDTVNLASRLEESSEPGRIHVSSEYREATRSCFEFELRGAIEIKGKGTQQTYFLTRERDGGPRVSSGLEDFIGAES